MKPKVDLALIDPIDRDNMMQLRAMMISGLCMLERVLHLPPSVLNREQRRKVESWTGVKIEEILGDEVEKDVL